MTVDTTSFHNVPVLITGGLGFIGSNLAIRLVEAGAKVTIVDSMIPSHGGNLFNIEPIKDRVRVNISDIRDIHGLRYLVRGQQYIFNLAGQVSHVDSMRDPNTDLEINSRSQLLLLECLRQENPDAKVILTSTRQVYGKPQYLPVDENHPVRPTDVNGINCFAGEWFHKLYWDVYGIRTCILRLTNTYGPRQLIRHNRLGFVGWFIRNILVGDKIQIFGDGSQLRDLTYVDDVVDAILLVALSDASHGEIFNLGGSQVISLKDLAELMCRVAGRSVAVEIVPFPQDQKKIDIGHYYADYGRINRAVGWKPRITLEEGFERVFRYYYEHAGKYL